MIIVRVAHKGTYTGPHTKARTSSACICTYAICIRTQHSCLTKRTQRHTLRNISNGSAYGDHLIERGCVHLIYVGGPIETSPI